MRGRREGPPISPVGTLISLALRLDSFPLGRGSHDLNLVPSFRGPGGAVGIRFSLDGETDHRVGPAALLAMTRNETVRTL